MELQVDTGSVEQPHQDPVAHDGGLPLSGDMQPFLSDEVARTSFEQAVARRRVEILLEQRLLRAATEDFDQYEL